MEYPLAVGDGEPLCRFAIESGKFSKHNKRVKPSLFMPEKGEVLSVFRGASLTKEQIIALGVEFVGTPRGRPILAYAEVLASSVREQELQLQPTLDPHPRHVDVVGWADDALNRHRAHILAHSATLHLNE